MRRPRIYFAGRIFSSFDTLDGGVFLHCGGLDCVVLEGGDRALFIEINKLIGLGSMPEGDQKRNVTVTSTAR